MSDLNAPGERCKAGEAGRVGGGGGPGRVNMHLWVPYQHPPAVPSPPKPQFPTPHQIPLHLSAPSLARAPQGPERQATCVNSPASQKTADKVMGLRRLLTR